jgi:hypothetical protein
MVTPELEVRDGLTKILSLRRQSIATGRGESTILRTAIELLC